MENIGKIAIGAAATALLAWGNHAVTGQAFIAALKAKAEAAAGPQVRVAMGTAVALNRTATLSGNVASDSQAALLAKVAAVPGIAGAKWLFDAPAPAARIVEVTKCQDNVDALLKDKMIQFRSGSAYIAGGSMKLIDSIAATLKPCTGTKIMVTGHTDAAGSAALNRALSQERADRVMAALVGNGLNPALLSAKGFGPDKPLAGKSPADPLNRRIEFTVSALTGEK